MTFAEQLKTPAKLVLTCRLLHSSLKSRMPTLYDSGRSHPLLIHMRRRNGGRRGCSRRYSSVGTSVSDHRSRRTLLTTSSIGWRRAGGNNRGGRYNCLLIFKLTLLRLLLVLDSILMSLLSGRSRSRRGGGHRLLLLLLLCLLLATADANPAIR